MQGLWGKAVPLWLDCHWDNANSVKDVLYSVVTVARSLLGL